MKFKLNLELKDEMGNVRSTCPHLAYKLELTINNKFF